MGTAPAAASADDRSRQQTVVKQLRPLTRTIIATLLIAPEFILHTEVTR